VVQMSFVGAVLPESVFQDYYAKEGSRGPHEVMSVAAQGGALMKHMALFFGGCAHVRTLVQETTWLDICKDALKWK